MSGNSGISENGSVKRGILPYGGKRTRGHPRQTTRRAYLNVAKKHKFDDEDCILGSDNGELRCIFDLIRLDSAEFHLRVDQGICDLVKEWLTSG